MGICLSFRELDQAIGQNVKDAAEQESSMAGNAEIRLVTEVSTTTFA